MAFIDPKQTPLYFRAPGSADAHLEGVARPNITC